MSTPHQLLAALGVPASAVSEKTEGALVARSPIDGSTLGCVPDAGAEFAWLPERDIAGNGHMPMCEDNSDEIAALIVAWLEAKGL